MDLLERQFILEPVIVFAVSFFFILFSIVVRDVLVLPFI